MNYVVDKVKEEQKEDVSILTHPHFILNNNTFFFQVSFYNNGQQQWLLTNKNLTASIKL